MVEANRSLSPRNRFAKRHYEAIATAMQDARFHLRNTALDQWLCVVNCLADVFAADNGQFKRELLVQFI
jgi:hypothetical protein